MTLASIEDDAWDDEPTLIPPMAGQWALEFPEVMGRGGFDAVVGNPPFIGGQRLTGAIGKDVREYLVEHLSRGKRGSADLLLLLPAAQPRHLLARPGRHHRDEHDRPGRHPRGRPRPGDQQRGRRLPRVEVPTLALHSVPSGVPAVGRMCSTTNRAPSTVGTFRRSCRHSTPGPASRATHTG